MGDFVDSQLRHLGRRLLKIRDRFLSRGLDLVPRQRRRSSLRDPQPKRSAAVHRRSARTP
jgi:hypothetical protein